jgi:hypothetical protein
VVCALVLAFLLFQGQSARKGDADGEGFFPTSVGWFGSKKVGDVEPDEAAGPTHGPTPSDMGAGAPKED